LSTPIAAGTLRDILRNTSIMGAGGLIQIGPEGYPLNKAVMIIHVDNNGNRALCDIYGQLLPSGSVSQVPLRNC
jgi:hypothetical protein